MAKKTSKTSSKKKFTWNGYATVNIPADHEQMLDEFVANGDEIFSLLSDILINKYKVSYDPPAEDGSYKATAICHDPDDPNFGMALSGWSDDWYGALASLLYKHYYVAKENWTDFTAPTKRKYR